MHKISGCFQVLVQELLFSKELSEDLLAPPLEWEGQELPKMFCAGSECECSSDFRGGRSGSQQPISPETVLMARNGFENHCCKSTCCRTYVGHEEKGEITRRAQTFQPQMLLFPSPPPWHTCCCSFSSSHTKRIKGGGRVEDMWPEESGG